MTADPQCEICAGTGEYEQPAEQDGGEIIESEMRACICTTQKDADEEIEDRIDADNRERESNRDSEDSGE